MNGSFGRTWKVNLSWWVSSNDGCVVARSVEAKALGIKGFLPYFQIADHCRRHGVAVFSSNYALYGDMSARMMQRC